MTPIQTHYRLLLIDDHALFREGLARVLESQPNFEVVGKAQNVSDGLDLVAKERPDIILLDVDLGTERAMDFLEQVDPSTFTGRILVVTAGISEREAVQLVQAGVSGIFHKHNPPENLIEIILQIAGGEVYMEQRYLKTLFQTVDQSQPESRPLLNERELRIMRLLLRGMANKEIGDQLGISESAVKAALRILFDKLGVRTRSQLVRVALEQYREELT